jgi:hypothetical protein
MVALYWDPTTGELSRLSERDEPFLRTLMAVWLETGDREALDGLILDALRKLVAGRRVAAVGGEIGAYETGAFVLFTLVSFALAVRTLKRQE